PLHLRVLFDSPETVVLLGARRGVLLYQRTRTGKHIVVRAPGRRMPLLTGSFGSCARRTRRRRLSSSEPVSPVARPPGTAPAPVSTRSSSPPVSTPATTWHGTASLSSRTRCPSPVRLTLRVSWPSSSRL